MPKNRKALNAINELEKTFNAMVGALENLEDEITACNYGRVKDLVKHLRNMPAWEVAGKFDAAKKAVS
jgi:hypothetical protein